MSGFENAIIVVGKTRLKQLEERFGTRANAEFYIGQQAKTSFVQKGVGGGAAAAAPMKAKKLGLRAEQVQMLNEIQLSKDAEKESKKAFQLYRDEEAQFTDVLEQVHRTLQGQLKVKLLERQYLTSYIFSEKDLVIVLGQDGLVANTAKYVKGQPIIAVNPDPERYDGILLPFSASTYAGAVQRVIADKYEAEDVCMAEAKLQDGQRLLAFNDLFIGPSTHTSARYKLTFNGNSEQQSSSGIIVSTGAGSTGWLSSLLNMANGIQESFAGAYEKRGDAEGTDAVQAAVEMNRSDPRLVFVVREPFRSKTSDADTVMGVLAEGQTLELESYMPTNGIIFSDGVENDFLKFNSGSVATIGVAAEKARLVRG